MTLIWAQPRLLICRIGVMGLYLVYDSVLTRMFLLSVTSKDLSVYLCRVNAFDMFLIVTLKTLFCLCSVLLVFFFYLFEPMLRLW